MPRRKVASWCKVGRLHVVQPPGWPKRTELSFTNQSDMIQWAHDNGYVLREVQPPNGGRYGRVAARNFG